MFLDSVRFPKEEENYPFSCVRNAEELRVTSAVSLFCGGNGAGKTTLIELIAQKYGCPFIGEGREKFPKALLNKIQISKTQVPKQVFRFSAEEFMSYTLWQKRAAREAKEEIERTKREFKGVAAGFAAMPHFRTLAEIENMYGRELTECSHGEGFIEFFKSRVREGGLYFLDEPEGALSYENQYRLGFLIRERAKENCQFVIATHSPVLLLIPDAAIYEIKDGAIQEKNFDDLEDIRFLEMFLRRRGKNMFD